LFCLPILHILSIHVNSLSLNITHAAHNENPLAVLTLSVRRGAVSGLFAEADVLAHGVDGLGLRLVVGADEHFRQKAHEYEL
jgi:hypothetical protein